MPSASRIFFAAALVLVFLTSWIVLPAPSRPLLVLGRNPPSPDPLDVRSIVRAFLGGTPDQVPDQYREASPITHVSGRLPHSLLIYGGRDHVVLSRFGAMLSDRLRAAGATSVFLAIPWAEHAFDAIPNGPSGQLSLYYTEQFLQWSLARASPDGRRLIAPY